jgi:putative endonuclease
MGGYMYILKCSDGSYYVGSTRDIMTRFQQHQDGEGAEYTRRRLPVELVFVQPCETIVQAYWFEKKVQNWSRAKREALIKGQLHLLPGLAKKRFKRPSASG